MAPTPYLFLRDLCFQLCQGVPAWRKGVCYVPQFPHPVQQEESSLTPVQGTLERQYKDQTYLKRCYWENS